jgi:gamma-glutamyl:cysteine ligase YbdK (ATP-grasp superfamily)
MADRLDEAIGQLRAELAVRWEVDAKPETLRTLVVRVWDLVMDNANGLSSLALSLSTVVELLKGRINTMTANWVY